MEIDELSQQGVTKITKPEWNKMAYLEIEITQDGILGAWGNLYDYPGSGSHAPIPLPLCMVWSDDYIAYPNAGNGME